MPNTRPALDEPGILRTVAHAQPSERIRARIFVIAAITKGRAGAQPVDFAALAAAGAVAFSDDGSTVMNARVLRDAAQAAGAVPGCFIVHCEDAQLKGEAVRDDGGLAEESIVARDLQIARATGKAWHIAHLSTARALQLVRDARACGTRVTCEVAPHHLHFTDALIETLGAGAKVNPPLRAAADVEALRAAVMREEIEAFASDHAPHTEQEKRADLATGAVGFSGLEIAVGAYALAVPQLPLSRFVAMCSTNPARILNVPGGALRLGDPADVTVFADRPWVVRSRAFRSKGTSTPFEGMTLPRRVLATICGGEVTYQAEAA